MNFPGVYPQYHGYVPGDLPPIPYPYSSTPESFTYFTNPLARDFVSIYLGFPIVIFFVLCFIGVVGLAFYTFWKTFYVISLLPRKERKIRLLRRVRKKKHEQQRVEGDESSESSSTDDPALQYPSESRLHKTQRETRGQRRRRKRKQDKRRMERAKAITQIAAAMERAAQSDSSIPTVALAAANSVHKLKIHESLISRSETRRRVSEMLKLEKQKGLYDKGSRRTVTEEMKAKRLEKLNRRFGEMKRDLDNRRIIPIILPVIRTDKKLRSGRLPRRPRKQGEDSNPEMNKTGRLKYRDNRSVGRPASSVSSFNSDMEVPTEVELVLRIQRTRSDRPRAKSLDEMAHDYETPLPADQQPILGPQQKPTAKTNDNVSDEGKTSESLMKPANRFPAPGENEDVSPAGSNYDLQKRKKSGNFLIPPGIGVVKRLSNPSTGSNDSNLSDEHPWQPKRSSAKHLKLPKFDQVIKNRPSIVPGTSASAPPPPDQLQEKDNNKQNQGPMPIIIIDKPPEDEPVVGLGNREGILHTDYISEAKRLDLYLPKKYRHLRRNAPGPVQRALLAKKALAGPKRDDNIDLNKTHQENILQEKEKIEWHNQKNRPPQREQKDYVEWNKDVRNTLKKNRQRSSQPDEPEAKILGSKSSQQSIPGLSHRSSSAGSLGSTGTMNSENEADKDNQKNMK